VRETELRLLRDALGNVDFDPSLYKEDAPTVVDKIRGSNVCYLCVAGGAKSFLVKHARL